MTPWARMVNAGLLAALRARPCLCRPCRFCGGTGVMGWAMMGGRYVSPTRSDDLEEPVGCDQCEDAEICYRRREIAELEIEAEIEREALNR